jgi:hypothetical protein
MRAPRIRPEEWTQLLSTSGGPGLSEPIPVKSDFQPSEFTLIMGVFRYVYFEWPIELKRRRRPASVVTLCIALGLLVGAAPTWAAGDDSDENPVSTSPITTESSNGDAHRVPSPARISTPPLTRAAERRQLERISPAEWLARYGRVDVERRR